MGKEQLLQYDIRYDQGEKNEQYIRTQLETHLRERFNVLVSTIEYEIVDGHLVGKGSKKPFIDTIKKGRDLIQRLFPNPIDFDRENAEVIGFGNVIDPFMADLKTPLFSKVLSVSSRGDEGSRYKHNFYDIFTLKLRNGKRYVEMSRYSSALTPKEYAERLGFDPNNPPKAEDFLSNPIKITDVFVSPEQIHQALHKEHEYMNPSEFDEIWTSSLVQFYVKRYESNRDALSFKAVLNAADEVWESKKRRGRGEMYKDYANYTPSYGEIRYLEEKDVRQVTTGCPGKSGADMDNSPFSVSDFVTKDRGYDFDHEGTCVVCKSGPKALGPCEICEQCTVKIEKEEELGRAA